jgi:VWFA-related protein
VTRPSIPILFAIAIASLAPPAPPQAPPFRSVIDAVRVDTLVLDRHTPVAGLTVNDFELLDAGVTQQIDDVQIVEVPFSMMLALDTSDSMEYGLPRLQEAARGAVAALRADDRAAALTFSQSVGTPTPWSSSRQPILDAIAGLRTNGTTSLVDAAFAALLQRDPEPGRRNLVILFTDGSDTSSWLPDEAALDLAARSDAVVYCVAIDQHPEAAWRSLQMRSGIRLTPHQPIMRSQEFLHDLAKRTGGESLSTSAASLQRTFRLIVDRFRSRYVLTYTPRAVAETGWHPINVGVRGKRYRVTARRGYQR